MGEMFHVNSLIDYVDNWRLKGGVGLPPRPLSAAQHKWHRRIRDSWLVLMGRADAVQWPSTSEGKQMWMTGGEWR